MGKHGCEDLNTGFGTDMSAWRLGSRDLHSIPIGVALGV